MIDDLLKDSFDHIQKQDANPQVLIRFLLIESTATVQSRDAPLSLFCLMGVPAVKVLLVLKSSHRGNCPEAKKKLIDSIQLSDGARDLRKIKMAKRLFSRWWPAGLPSQPASGSAVRPADARRS